MKGQGIEIEYKELVVELLELTRAGKVSRAMLELRVTLFVAACASHNRDQCLLPFPYCFFDSKTNTKDFEGLLEHVRLIPALDKIDEKMNLPALTWALLYWVLTNPLTISPLFQYDTPLKDQLRGITNHIEEKTGLWLPEKDVKSDRVYFAFEVTTPTPKPAFVEGKAKFGSYFAFHGSPLGNFHSIIHRGLLSALNRRSSYGVGTYLSSNFHLSNPFSSCQAASVWREGAFGKILNSVAICEVVDAPTGLTKHTLPVPPSPMPLHGSAGAGASQQNEAAAERSRTLTVVTDDDLVQLAYVLLLAPGHSLKEKDTDTNAAQKTAHARVCGDPVQRDQLNQKQQQQMPPRVNNLVGVNQILNELLNLGQFLSVPNQQQQDLQQASPTGVQPHQQYAQFDYGGQQVRQQQQLLIQQQQQQGSEFVRQELRAMVGARSMSTTTSPVAPQLQQQLTNNLISYMSVPDFEAIWP